MNGVERSIDPHLWHACAGGMIQMPLPNSKVSYFPQGHVEHTRTNVDFSGMRGFELSYFAEWLMLSYGQTFFKPMKFMVRLG